MSNDKIILRRVQMNAIHHKAKLTDEKVRMMRKRYMAYLVGYETLAREFGCGISTARDICTYRTRKNVV